MFISKISKNANPFAAIRLVNRSRCGLIVQGFHLNSRLHGGLKLFPGSLFMSNANDSKTAKPETTPLMTETTPADAKAAKELSDAQIQEVVGGLSPQPLPPRRGDQA